MYHCRFLGVGKLHVVVSELSNSCQSNRMISLTCLLRAVTAPIYKSGIHTSAMAQAKVAVVRINLVHHYFSVHI